MPVRPENQPLVSVIVPIYNAKNHIARCIESIRRQTYRNLEILLLNDGSQDVSLAVCRMFAKVDPRIIQETVDGVFRELPSKCAGHHLHVDTPVREHHTEEAAEDIHDRDPLFLSNITLEEKTPDVEPFHKFCSKI